ncbi:unnamed protein product [Durusdinium trenchii]|uniref:Uncharacterized protein n=1 Tax=Durusdinium trenchii TaxID=1381693 RepID=A0ABP0N559_9DINO
MALLLHPVAWIVLAQIPQASALSKYQGPKPPWPYKGFTSFPAFYFGANESGECFLAALCGATSSGWLGVAAEFPQCGPRQVSLAQMATRMATYIEVTPKTPEKRLQAKFVYRHLEIAEWYFMTSAAAYHDPSNADLFLHDREGRLCWDSFGNTGPYWNFSNPRVSDWILNEVASEIGREANVQAVFFDETDYLYCGGTAGNCSADVHTGEEGLAQYRAKLQLLRSLSLTLNRKKVWPIYSSYNGYSDLPWRKCLMPFDEYFNVLQDVGWIRFYEFGIGATSPSAAWDSQATLAQAMRESELGLPVMVRATPQANAKSGASLPLGLFLLVQNDYWYLGISTGWLSENWQWWPEYDKLYGSPLGQPELKSDGWHRRFQKCHVFVSTDLTHANVTFTDIVSL